MHTRRTHTCTHARMHSTQSAHTCTRTEHTHVHVHGCTAHTQSAHIHTEHTCTCAHNAHTRTHAHAQMHTCRAYRCVYTQSTHMHTHAHVCTHTGVLPERSLCRSWQGIDRACRPGPSSVWGCEGKDGPACLAWASWALVRCQPLQAPVSSSENGVSKCLPCRDSGSMREILGEASWTHSRCMTSVCFSLPPAAWVLIRESWVGSSSHRRLGVSP